MREDQLLALTDIQADVCDMFIEECQVNTWPAMDTKEGRGDRVWFKHNATASLKIVAQIESVLAARAARLANGQQGPNDDEATDKLLKRISRKADELLDRAGVPDRKQT